MRFMILRKADRTTEAELLPSPQLVAQMARYYDELVQAGVLIAGAGLQASAKGLRVRFAAGNTSVVDGPFAETKELIAGFSMIDVPSRADAIDWVRRWPALDGDGEVEIEIREVGCAGGLRGVDPSCPSAGTAAAPRFMILLKADRDFEAGLSPGEQRLAAMAQRNDDGVKAGVLLAAEGLQPTANGVRVKFSGGKPSVIDGPFAEAKELVAGFWLIQVNSREEAIEWVRRYPYPREADAEFEVEIRKLVEAADFATASLPERGEAAQRLREHLLEAGQRLSSGRA